MKNKSIITAAILFILIINKISFSQEWESFTLPCKPIVLKFINYKTGYVAGYSQSDLKIKLYKTINYGENWSGPIISIDHKSSGVTDYPSRPAFEVITQDIIIFYHGNTIYRTTNGGANWTYNTISNLDEQNGMQSMKFINSNTGFITHTDKDHIQNGTKIYKTNDQGQSWFEVFTAVNSNTKIFFYLTDIQYIYPNVYFIGLHANNTIGNQYEKNYSVVYNENNSSFSPNLHGGGITGQYYTWKYMSILPGNQMKITGFKNNSSNTFGVYCYENLNDPVGDGNLITQSGTANSTGGFAFSDLNNGYAYISNQILKTTNSGLNWNAIYQVQHDSWNHENNLQVFGDVVYCGNYASSLLYRKRININLSSKSDFESLNWKININGTDYPTPDNYIFRGGEHLIFAPEYTEKVFYKWSNGRMQNSIAEYVLLKDGSNLESIYKSKNIADNPWAINNPNQTKAIRDTNLQSLPNGIIHQVHESIGGIFYSRSTNNGDNFQSEEVVNYDSYLNDVDGNRNPSINVKRYSNNKPFTIADENRNVVAVWERYNSNTQHVSIMAADRVSNAMQTGYEWDRYWQGGTTNYPNIDSFPANNGFLSYPKIFAIATIPSNPGLYNCVLVVPHLEPVPGTNNKKLVITIRYQSQVLDFVVDDGTTGMISNFAVSAPHNNYYTFDLHITYQKDNSVNNIVYKNITAGWNLNSLFVTVNSSIENIGALDGFRARYSPDISTRNGLPVITYSGNYYSQKIVHFEDVTEEDQVMSLLNHTTVVSYKKPDGTWGNDIYEGLSPQENPNIEGSKNISSHLLSFKKNNIYYQYVKIDGQSQYYCNPNNYSQTDAKLVRGCYSHSAGSITPQFSPLLLTLSAPDNLKYTIGKQTFNITNINSGSDGYDNLYGTIEKDNVLYLLTLGPIIASNTTYGFNDDTPPETIHNPIEFNEEMISNTFTLSNLDTLILGAHGRYETSDGLAFEPMKYHVNLVNAQTGQIHRELFKDTVNVEDTLGTEFLRGFIINNIANGSSEFYIQMIVDEDDAGDGEYMMAGVYEDNTPPEGDNSINYSTKIVFEDNLKIADKEGSIINKYELFQNYPNPFNPVTNIQFQVPSLKFVKIVIYDILGREVKVLVNEIKSPGNHSVTFDASSLSSGVYFYKMTAGEFSDVKRMVLVK